MNIERQRNKPESIIIRVVTDNNSIITRRPRKDTITIMVLHVTPQLG